MQRADLRRSGEFYHPGKLGWEYRAFGDGGLWRA